MSFSRLLARHGIASARFDFLGSGESDGEFQDMTLSGEIEDARAVLDHLARVRGVDRRRLFLLGLSAGRHGRRVPGRGARERGEHGKPGVRGLVLWAPAGEISERIRERAGALQGREAPAEEAAASRDPLDYGGLRVGARYVSDAMQLQVLRRSAAYTGPVLVAFGTSDPVVPPEVGRRYGELYGPRARLVPIEGAGHVFESAVWREELFRRSLEFLLAIQ